MSSSYNHIPYQSAPITQTQLSHLAALGLLHGIQTPMPECCRVLEIGCAEGNNLIPMAQRWPDSEFLGIDLSSVQIAHGQALLRSLKLDNLRLETKNILDLQAKSLGQFDYIIVHGVYSWVPENVQQHILKLIQTCLSPQGLAYISYNTYPGWHTQKVLRDALQLYCQAEDGAENRRDTHQKAEYFNHKQTRLKDAVAYFKEFFNVAPNTFARHYVKELHAFDDHHDAYIYHEYLESYNQPLYFKDFARSLQPYGLQYMCDTYLPIETPFLFGKKVRQLLERFGDRIERLQYLDFLLNQRFRRSLICHQNLSLQESFGPLELTQLAFRGRLRSRLSPNLVTQKKQRFYKYDESQYHTTLKHPVSKAAVHILTEHYPSSLAYEDLLQKACQRVAKKSGLKHLQVLEPFYHELYLLCTDNWLQIEHQANAIATIDWLQNLSINDLSFHTLQHYGYIPTPLHEAIEVDGLGRTVLNLLKQGITREQLWQRFRQQHHSKTETGWKKLKIFSPLERYYLKKRLYLFLELLRDNGVLKNI